MKKFALLVLLLLFSAFAFAQTIGSANVTATGAFTLAAGQTLSLKAQIVGCPSGAVPTYQGNPISNTPNQTSSSPFTANGSEVVSFTVPGNDQVLCGGQNYTLYAITWLINGFPAAPTKTYRFVDGTTTNLNTATAIGFVPPIINNAIGSQCSAGYVLNGYNKDFTPICQALSSAQTVVSTSVATAQNIQSSLTAPNFIGPLTGTASGNLPLSGGTLTGPLTLSSNPTIAFEAATKNYVDAGDATRLPLTGGTLSGTLNGSNLATKLPRVNVTHPDFGTASGCANAADPTGVNDSTCAIQAAIAWAVANQTGDQIPQIYFPPGNYKISSTLTLNNISLVGDDATIHYIVSTGTAILFTTGTNPSSLRYGIFGLQISGPGTAGNTAVGVEIDSPYVDLHHVGIGSSGSDTHFHVGIEFGNNAYLITVDDSALSDNDQEVLFPAGLTNAGENMQFTNTTFSNNVIGGYVAPITNCVVLGTAPMQAQDFRFTNDSFDSCQVVNHDNRVYFINPHFEANVQLTAPMVVTWADNFDGSFGLYGTSIINGEVVIDNGASGNGVFEVDNYGNLSIYGLKAPTSTIPLAYINGATAWLTIVAPALEIPQVSLYTVAAGNPMLDIDTFFVHTKTLLASKVWAATTTASGYLQKNAMAYVGNSSMPGLDFGAWSGTANNWDTARIVVNGYGKVFNFCTGGFLSLTDYTQLGSETVDCKITMNDGTLNTPALTLNAGHSFTRHTIITASLAPVSVGANTCAAQSLTVTGINVGDHVINRDVSPSFQAGLSLDAVIVTGANTVSVNFCNVTGAAITPVSGTYTFDVEQ